MDRAVSLRKFDAEIRSLRTESAPYVAARGWTIAQTDYPVLSVILRHPRSSRRVEFRFTCDGWDEQPPSLTLHDSESGGEFTWEQWPKEVWSVLNKHPGTGKPALCLPGIREYHTHPNHRSDRWDGYRLLGTYRLRDIVDRVQQRFEDSNG